MPIKNLPVRLHEAYKVKIGQAGQKRTNERGREWHVPEKLDHFIITTCERDQHGKFILAKEIMAELGAKPLAVPVRLMSDDIDVNFDTSYTVYVGGKCLCRGDGEKAIRREAVREGKALRLTGKTKEVPCGDACPFYRYRSDGKSPEKYNGGECKPSGILRCILECSQTVGGVAVFRTSSRNTILAITNSLNVIKTAASGFLAGLKLQLTFSKQVKRQADGTPRTIPVINIEYPGPLSDLRDAALKAAQARSSHQIEMRRVRALLACTKDTAQDEAEHSEEFAPDAHGVEVLPPDDTSGNDAQPAEYTEHDDPETGDGGDDELPPSDFGPMDDGPEIPEDAFDRKPSKPLAERQAETRRILEDGTEMDPSTGEITNDPGLTEGELKLMGEPPAQKTKRRSAVDF